jgi:U4/U6.U5 tri-snRNP-associated protein 1
MPSEDVIELSVDETNKLRATLGLKPLRMGNNNIITEAVTTATVAEGTGENFEKEELELSVEETNKLRAKLGLAPLRENKNKEIHKPAENTGEQEEASQRIERSKLQRQVEKGAAQDFGSSTLGDAEDDETNNNENDNNSALSWAAMMRQQENKAPPTNPERSKKKKKEKYSKEEDGYDESNLEGMQVRNSMAGLEAGGNTVLTLADAPILETKTFVSNKVVGINEEEDALENVDLTEQEKQQDGLRKKRMLELGMGRAGGYAGFDDEEFEELGGTLGPSRKVRGSGNKQDDEKQHQTLGFRIGSQKKEDTTKTDVDKVQHGEAISLVWKGDIVSSDYMTVEEEENNKDSKRKKKKKDTKFKKKAKKSKKRRRRTEIDDDNDDEEEGANQSSILTPSNTSVLSKLEETARSNDSSSLHKRRRTNNDTEDGTMQSMSNGGGVSTKEDNTLQQQSETKRSDYDKIMEKGNKRTRIAFDKKKAMKKKEEDIDLMDEEPDDSFLNAALAKARRLNRLREMNMNKSSSTGADAVAEAVKSSSALASAESNDSKKSSGISFSIDDTREFSRAIRARTQQRERETQKKETQDNDKLNVGTSKEKEENTLPQNGDENVDNIVKKEDTGNDEEVEDVDMEELAKEVKEDEPELGYDGSTADKVGVGRGLSSFISMLKTTGEITGKHGGKEELRGRAKDERNYDNYEPLDLSKVVTIGKNATDKDEELATREIKLEYRDKHGRLLTQKEAYRDLCYQFHGHGASKKKEEKRLTQIAREQAEARLASGQVSAARDGTTAGTLGALKATQKATGKAFIVHKT